LTYKSRTNFFHDFLFLLPVSVFFLLFDLGKGSLASWDEAIYAVVAKEIVQSGNWLHLTFGGQPWCDRPPLCLWATACFFKCFGIHEFSARLFSALCGLGAGIVTYLLGARLFNRWIGLWGALVLLSSSDFLHFSRLGMMDAPLTFFISLSMYFFWLGRERRRYLVFSGIAIGLALLAKGLIAFFVFPILWIYCFWAGELEVLGRSTYWIGVMIAVAIALPWNVYEMITCHNVSTFTILERHSGSAYFYIRTLVNNYHPWVLAAIVSGPYFLFKAIKERTPEMIFLTVWMLFVFVWITLRQTKWSGAILPLYPALSLTAGFILAKMFNENQRVLVQGLFLLILALHVPYSHIFRMDYSRDLKGIAEIVQKEVPQKETLYLYNYHEIPAAMFYLERKGTYLDGKESLISALGDRKSFFCLIHDEDWRSILKDRPNLGIAPKGFFENLALVTKRGR